MILCCRSYFLDVLFYFVDEMVLPGLTEDHAVTQSQLREVIAVLNEVSRDHGASICQLQGTCGRKGTKRKGKLPRSAVFFFGTSRLSG